MDDLRTVRAVLFNALLWGGTWVAGAVAVIAILVAVGILPSVPTFIETSHLLTSLGLAGFFSGAFFSGALRLAYRGRHLLEINSVLFALGGGAVAGFIAPFVSGMLFIVIPIGAVTAGVTLEMAKAAERQRLAESSGAPMLEGETVQADGHIASPSARAPRAWTSERAGA